MRTNVEQFSGLEKVIAAAAKKQNINHFLSKVCIVWWVPDVVTIKLPDQCELIYAADGYDLWVGGDLKQPDLSFDQAVNVILTSSAKK